MKVVAAAAFSVLTMSRAKSGQRHRLNGLPMEIATWFRHETLREYFSRLLRSGHSENAAR